MNWQEIKLLEDKPFKIPLDLLHPDLQKFNLCTYISLCDEDNLSISTDVQEKDYFVLPYMIDNKYLNLVESFKKNIEEAVKKSIIDCINIESFIIHQNNKFNLLTITTGTLNTEVSQ